jgi:hypothetical protein
MKRMHEHAIDWSNADPHVRMLMIAPPVRQTSRNHGRYIAAERLPSESIYVSIDNRSDLLGAFGHAPHQDLQEACSLRVPRQVIEHKVDNYCVNGERINVRASC